MALTKGDKIICADVIAKDFIMRSGNEQDVSFDLSVVDDENRSEFDIGSSGLIYRANEKANSNSVDVDIDSSKALIQINHEYEGGDVHSTNSLELSANGSYLRNKDTSGDVGELRIHGEELTFNGNKVFVDNGDTYIVTNETSSVDSVTEMYKDKSGNGKPAHFGCFGSDVGDDIGIGSDGVYLCMPYGSDSENYGHIIAGDDESNAGDASLYHAALDSDGGIGRWRRVLDSENYTDYISGGGGSVVTGSKLYKERHKYSVTAEEGTLRTWAQDDWGYEYCLNGKYLQMTIYGKTYANDRLGRRIYYTLPFKIKTGVAYPVMDTIQTYTTQGIQAVYFRPQVLLGNGYTAMNYLSAEITNTNVISVCGALRYQPSNYNQNDVHNYCFNDGQRAFMFKVEGIIE